MHRRPLPATYPTLIGADRYGDSTLRIVTARATRCAILPSCHTPSYAVSRARECRMHRVAQPGEVAIGERCAQAPQELQGPGHVMDRCQPVGEQLPRPEQVCQVGARVVA